MRIVSMRFLIERLLCWTECTSFDTDPSGKSPRLEERSINEILTTHRLSFIANGFAREYRKVRLLITFVFRTHLKDNPTAVSNSHCIRRAIDRNGDERSFLNFGDDKRYESRIFLGRVRIFGTDPMKQNENQHRRQYRDADELHLVDALNIQSA